MKPGELIAPTVPVSYVLLVLSLMAERGIGRERLLHGLSITEELLQHPDGRIHLLTDYATLCTRAMALSNDPGLGYEFGLRSTLTTHGIVGYGLMSQPTLRHVLDFAARFGTVLRMPAWNLRFFSEDGHAVMQGLESISHGALRAFSCQQLIISCYAVARDLFPGFCQDMVLHFDFAEPPYHARYADRLPTCRFNMPFNEFRLPMSYADIPLKSADQISAKLAERECERELALFGGQNQDVVRQVRAQLVLSPHGYPNLDAVAQRQCVSARTLTRQLQARGTHFRALLTEAQKRDAQTLLSDPRLDLTDIALRLGYSSLTNFARAFREWHDVSPGEFRSSMSHKAANRS
jgi:AraC-like DNA-binding protein